MKAKIVVRGTSVQDVGYRLFLLERAGVLSGFEAINTAEGLAVMVEGSEKRVNDFIKVVREERPDAARVTSVRIEKYAGGVMRLKDFRDQFSVEQLAKIAVTGVEMKGDIKDIKSNTEETKHGIKSMLSKQDETISEVRGLRSDLKTWMEERFSRLETDVRTIKEKVGLT